jgi:hypothetical protein
MSPERALSFLGLCNVVAGALVALAPALLMPGADGLGSTAARLLGGSLGIVLAGSGIGAFRMPGPAVRPYLWVFGIGVKLAAAAAWSAMAGHSGILMLWGGAALDLGIAVVCALALARR